jgi:RES domain-containing protein
MRLWRISSYPGLSGLGGTFVDGRWHTKPRHVIYAAEHPALAMVEVLAHMNLSIDSIPITLRLISIDVAKRAKRSPSPELPTGWQANQPATRRLGNQWLDAGDALLLPVPSAILPESRNYLINPQHSQAARGLVENDHGPFWIDPRFVR